MYSSEKNNNKPKISRLAIASYIVLGVIALLAIESPYLHPRMRTRAHQYILFAFISFICPVVGIVLGALAASEINKSGGKLRGKKLAYACIIIHGLIILFFCS